MVRPRKVNKIPMTTIAISEPLLRKMAERKPSMSSWYDFVNKVYYEWLDQQETIRLWSEDLANVEARVAYWKNKALSKEEENILQV